MNILLLIQIKDFKENGMKKSYFSRIDKVHSEQNHTIDLEIILDHLAKPTKLKKII